MADEECIEYNYSVLDKIDFLPYIQKYKGKKVWDLLYAVEDDYDNTELTNNDILEGCTLNWLCEDEIIEYLEKRYPKEFKWYETVEHWIG